MHRQEAWVCGLVIKDMSEGKRVSTYSFLPLHCLYVFILIFGCSGSSLLCVAFLQLGRVRAAP